MKEYMIRYGKSQLDVLVFRPAAIKHLPKKIMLWIEIKYLEWKRDQIVRDAIKMFNGKIVKEV